MDKAIIDRFFTHVNKDTESGCWEWTASIRSSYGSFHLNGKTAQAHRTSWVIHFGDIPKDADDHYRTKHVLHTCDNHLCVNPAHLFLGDVHDNMSDKIRKHRQNTPKGSEAANSKLNEEKVMEARRLFMFERVKLKTLAERYGVSVPAIQKAIYRKTWKHV